MSVQDQGEAATPEPPDEEGARRRLQLEDDYEAILLTVMSLEEEWLLDDRIAFSLRKAA